MGGPVEAAQEFQGVQARSTLRRIQSGIRGRRLALPTAKICSPYRLPPPSYG